MKYLLSVSLLVALGCNTTSTEAATEPTAAAHSGSEHQPACQDEHGQPVAMPEALHHFHEVFAAHWHGDHSATSVCPDVQNITEAADAAVDAHQASFPEQTAEVSAKSDALAAACAATPSGGETYDQALDQTHTAMEQLIRAVRHAGQ